MPKKPDQPIPKAVYADPMDDKRLRDKKIIELLERIAIALEKP